MVGFTGLPKRGSSFRTTTSELLRNSLDAMGGKRCEFAAREHMPAHGSFREIRAG